MLPAIRLATPKEIEEVKDHSDLTPTSAVWVWPNDKGQSDIAVVRNCWELDPMLFGETSTTQRRVLFSWGLFNMLRVSGITEIYFDVDADGPADWKSILEKIGAEKTTEKPQYRYKLVL